MSTARKGGAHLFVYALFLPHFYFGLRFVFFEGTHLRAPGFGEKGFLSLSHTFGVTAPSSEGAHILHYALCILH